MVTYDAYEYMLAKGACPMGSLRQCVDHMVDEPTADVVILAERDRQGVWLREVAEMMSARCLSFEVSRMLAEVVLVNGARLRIRSEHAVFVGSRPSAVMQ